MNQESYDVYFSGSCLKTTDPLEAKRKIGALFKLKGEKLERLFSGTPVLIKRGVDMDRAIKFRVTFRDAGALVDIVPTGQPAPMPQPPTPLPTPPLAATAPAPTASSGGRGELSLAEGPPATEADKPTAPLPVPDFDLSAPNDFDLSDCAPEVLAAPLPDISRIDLDKPGSTLDESPAPVPLKIDTEALELDAPGTALIETPRVAPPAIDTGDMTLSAPREGSLESYQVPVAAEPLPDIDHLQLAETSEEEAKPRGKAKFAIAED